MINISWMEMNDALSSNLRVKRIRGHPGRQIMINIAMSAGFV